ncbi:MAG: prepilin-type N-terminal cleavage/methylation domain-containing protein [Deltaproteobacteria bacterium]|nr:prepilin-type N-terminal cleavage/methylation domain-containing protein [Deltaproteobacteria bacterium]MCB9788159.1 prepilin-type N-terminal cleavage/methylation domain-containing protein [Deltaproteobacteria bacterium]
MNRLSATRLPGGFTLVEVLIVVVVSTLGFVALFGMQVATLRGLANTRRIIEATNLAENFLEQLRVEFSQWTEEPNQGLDGSGVFPHLSGLPVGPAAAAGAQTDGGEVTGAPAWVIGDDGLGTDRRVSVVGDLDPTGTNAGIRAASISPGSGDLEQPFCLHYRLTWLIPNRSIRAEVEVVWPLESANMEAFLDCDTLASAALGDLRSVSLTTNLSVNTFLR